MKAKAKMLLLALLVAASAAEGKGLVFRAVYEGAEMSDAFSAIHALESGAAIVAGKRSSTPAERIFRSTDGGAGQAWASIGPIAGYTGAHTYWFGSRKSTVLSGTGDVGSPCVLRSVDDGKTWAVVLNASQIKALAGGVDPGAAYSPLPIGGEGGSTWLLSLRSASPGRHLIESTDDGRSWHSFAVSGLTAGPRRMMVSKDGSKILYAGTFADAGQSNGLFISNDRGKTWGKHLAGQNVFAGMEDLGNGVYLVGTYSLGPKAITLATRERKGGIAIIRTATTHGLSNGTRVGIYGMSDPTFDVRPCTEVEVIDGKTLAYLSPGPDSKEAAETAGRVCGAAHQKIFRSADFGNTWTQVAETTVYTELSYIRTIVHVGNSVVYAFACANENSWGDRALATYRSLDAGATWAKIPDEEEYIGRHGRLNAVYEAVIHNGKLFAATQPDSAILVADL